MSMRKEMLQVARLAPKLLGESAPLMIEFLRGQFHSSGGFMNRNGEPDLYYTAFGIDALISLQAELSLSKLDSYVNSFEHGENLDFVHLCCLARCHACLQEAGMRILSLEKTLGRIESFRTPDGGYNQIPGQPFGTIYGAFLAVGAYQDLRATLPKPLQVVQSLKFLETPDGAWSNDRNLRIGSTNATAAAVTVLRNLSMPINSDVSEWLLKQAHREGGFFAAPGTPMPDLLSTATALHALAGLQSDISGIKEVCLDFLDTLWDNRGGFHGHWADDALDVEYSFYGLLALGHLSI